MVVIEGPLYLILLDLNRSLKFVSGIDLEKPRPDQKSVGMRDSPSGFFCIAEEQEKIFLIILIVICFVLPHHW